MQADCGEYMHVQVLPLDDDGEPSRAVATDASGRYPAHRGSMSWQHLSRALRGDMSQILIGRTR